MSPETKKRLIRFSIASLIFIGLAYFVQIYLGYMNVGQSFGVLGPYNRGLAAVEEMDDFTVASSRLRRTFHYKIFSTLENYAIRVEDLDGKSATITFDKGAPEFEETNRERLQDFIRNEAIAQIAAELR